MQHYNPDPKNGPNKKEPRLPETNPGYGREGGDDSLADANPTDARADEKVIVNEQESNRTVNRPSQTELGRGGDDVVND